MRVNVYIDGFNLYYRKLKHSRYKWIDLRKLSFELLAETDSIQCIRYFTADVSARASDHGAPERQANYFRALRTIPELVIHKGKFLAKKITRPLVSEPTKFVLVHDTEEKGSDVNLASYLLMDAFSDTFDAALIISQDTDLLTPIRMVREEFGKEVIVGWMEDRNPGKHHRKVASSIRRINDSMLRRSEFPTPLTTVGGAKLHRPSTWDPERRKPY